MKEYLRNGVSIVGLVLRLVVMVVLGVLCYCAPWIIVALGAGLVVVWFFGKKMKKVVAICLSIILTLSPLVLADGLLYGAKVPYSFIFMRGITRIMYNEVVKSTDENIAETLETKDYGESGYRDSLFEAQDGEEYTQYITEEGTVMEKFVPNNTNGKAVLMVHGGAYIGKMNDMFNDYIRWYSEAGNGAAVYAVDYKVAPNYHYKDTITDVINGYNDIIGDGYNPSDIVIAGDSAGGGLTLATVLYMRDELGYTKEQLPKGIITISAWTNLKMDSPSYSYNKRKDPQFGGNKLLQRGVDLYVTSEEELRNVYVSPYYCEDYTDFPSMLMQVGSYEMLKDDTQHIADTAKKQGIDVTAEVYGGMFHEFQMLKGRVSVADKAWESISNFLTDMYGGK